MLWGHLEITAALCSPSLCSLLLPPPLVPQPQAEHTEAFPDLKSPRSLLRPDHQDSQGGGQRDLGELGGLGSPLELELKRSVPKLMAKVLVCREHQDWP